MFKFKWIGKDKWNICLAFLNPHHATGPVQYYNSIDQKHFHLIYLHILKFIQKISNKGFQMSKHSFSLGILFQHIAIKQYFQSMGSMVSRNKCLVLWLFFFLHLKGELLITNCVWKGLETNPTPKLHHCYHSFGNPFKAHFSPF